MRYWQDLQPGETFTTTSFTVTQEDILEFAAEFDPQPYHLDNRAARESIFGGLCASGWQVTALMMRLITEALQAGSVALLGSTGVSQLRWRIPVFAGDTLSARLQVTECAECGQAGLGDMLCSIAVENQDRAVVLDASMTLQVQLRNDADLQDASGHG